MKWYIATVQRELAKMGFTPCPLTESQLADMYRRNIKVDQACRIGRDVDNGHAVDVIDWGTLDEGVTYRNENKENTL